MRLRFAVLAVALTTLASVTVPSVVSAAPRHNHHLTIAASPNPVLAGEGVIIYGRLLGQDSGGQTIRLYHHLNGSGNGYSLVGSTTTDSAGYYEFTRQEDVVYTNREWFVRGPDGSHSRVVRELVQPLVTMSASATSSDTNHPIVFSGDVTPNHAFDRVFLQEQVGSSDDWHTLASTQLGPGSHYTLAYRWHRPGVRDVRIFIRRDDRNLAGASDPVTVDIEQAQVPGFTINTSDPIVPAGSSVKISGVLDQPGTTSPEPNTPVELWGRTPDHHYVVLGMTSTASDGSYSFTQAGLTTNMQYFVATLPADHAKRRHTAVLNEGVQDVLTMTASSNSATVGQTVTFSGAVMPDKAGHVIYLQRQGKDGDWHTVQVRIVRNDSTYSFDYKFGSPGTFNFRARITSDERNVGAHSAPATVTVTLPPASSLPPAS
jgi:hypothetical protein